MRCNYCNVDLPETYKLCPLCGNPASDEQVRIEGITAVPYPDNPPSQEIVIKKEKSPFTFEKIKAFFNR